MRSYISVSSPFCVFKPTKGTSQNSLGAIPVSIMFSDDLRWRAIALIHVYGVHPAYVSDVLGPNIRSLQRWYLLFRRSGTVRENDPRKRTSRWPEYVLEGVRKYVTGHPTFYLEELQAHVKTVYPEVTNISLSTVCRALHFDLRMSRKILTRFARESVPHEVCNYKAKLDAIYSFPEDMHFGGMPGHRSINLR